MKSIVFRILATAALATLGWLVLAGAASKDQPVLEPSKLVILSTTDVVGKTSPCG